MYILYFQFSMVLILGENPVFILFEMLFGTSHFPHINYKCFCRVMKELETLDSDS